MRNALKMKIIMIRSEVLKTKTSALAWRAEQIDLPGKQSLFWQFRVLSISNSEGLM